MYFDPFGALWHERHEYLNIVMILYVYTPSVPCEDGLSVRKREM